MNNEQEEENTVNQNQQIESQETGNQTSVNQETNQVLSREVLESVWQRIGQMSTEDRAIIIRHLSHIPNRVNTNQISSNEENETPARIFINRRRSRNLFNVSPRVNNTDDYDYIDFRLYPEAIDWNDIENGNKDSFEIFTYYGYFGSALKTSLSSFNGIKITSSNLLVSILAYFSSIILNNKADQVMNFMKALPKLKSIKYIIENKLFSKRDLTSIKIVLDIYEKYFSIYDGPLSNNMKNDYLPVCKLFYFSLSNEDIKYLFEQIVNNKKLYQIISKFFYLNVLEQLKIRFLFEHKQMYINQIAKLMNEYNKLLNGLVQAKFVL